MLEDDSTFQGLEVDLFWVCYLGVVLHGFQDGPRGTQEAPRPSKSAHRASKRSPRAPQKAPRGPQETPRAGQEGSRPCKITPKEFKRTLSARQLRISVLRLEKNTIPKTIVHISVADVAEIVKDKTMLSLVAVIKGGRAAVFPLGGGNTLTPPLYSAKEGSVMRKTGLRTTGKREESEPQGRGKSQNHREDGRVEDRHAPHTRWPRGPADILELSYRFKAI